MKKKRDVFIFFADPGLKGGIGIKKRGERDVIALIKMPAYYTKKKRQQKTRKNPTGKGKGKKGHVDFFGVRSFIKQHVPKGAKLVAAIEDIGIQPKFGAISNAGMATSKALLVGVCAGRGATILLVKPSAWQTVIFGPRRRKANKLRSIREARRRRPECAKQLQLKGCDGPAEALLILDAAEAFLDGYADTIRGFKIQRPTD